MRVLKKTDCGIIIGSKGLAEWQKLCLERLSKNNDVQLKWLFFIEKNLPVKSGELFNFPFASKSIFESVFDLEEEINRGNFPESLKIVRINKDNINFSAINLNLVINLSDLYFDRMPNYFHAECELWQFKVENNNNGLLQKMLKRKNSVSIFLERLFNGSKHVLKSGTLEICNHSVDKTINNILNEIYYWPAEMFNRYSASAENIADSPLLVNAALKTVDKRDFRVNLWIKIRLLYVLLQSKLKHYIKTFFYEYQWNVGYIDDSVENIIEKKQAEINVKWLFTPKRSEFYADPFGIKTGDKYYIYYEYLNPKTKKGEIHSCEIASPLKTHKILGSNNSHFSYPFLFKKGGDLFMMPENLDSNALKIYKPSEFPHNWVNYKSVISDIRAIDTTLFYFEETWWLALTKKERGPDLNLFLYYSEDFIKWLPHKKNPVKTDITSARPGGSPFWYKNRFIRPTQNSSKTYGGSINFFEIKTLTPFDFEEVKFHELTPDLLSGKYQKGVHTFCLMSDRVVIDGKRLVFRPEKLLSTVKKVIGVA